MEAKHLIRRVYSTFSAFGMPVHVTHHTHCLECADHDAAVRMTPNRELSIEQIGTVAWSPVTFFTADAMAYYMPRLIELAILNPDDRDGDPFVILFIVLIGADTGRPCFTRFDPEHRRLVAEAFRYIDESHRALVDACLWGDALDLAVQAWSEPCR